MKAVVAVSHFVQVTMATLAVVIGYLATQQEVVSRLPYGISAGILVAVATTIGLISKSIFPVVTTTTTTTVVPLPGPPGEGKPPPVGPLPKIGAQETKVRTVSDRPPPRSDMRVGLVVSGFLVLFIACAEMRKAEVPAGDLAACIAVKALAGESVAQIVLHCDGDVPAVLTALLSAQKPPSVSAGDWAAVRTSKAGAEAKRSKAAAMAAPESP